MAAPYQVDRFLTGQYSHETLTDRLAEPVLDQRRHPGQWFLIFGLAFIFMNVMLMSITYLLYRGVGIWGINVPVGWGFDIINFVWWIGIGHAGTLISAILLLMRQQWRNSINRYAETMTLFAVMCAGMYPLLHTGRPWVAYWLMPFVPNVLAMTPQFRSPLIWDVFAVTTYLTVSALFWFIGLVPDFATLRDRAKNSIARVLFAIGAMGWRGSARHWQRYEQAYLLLAGLSTPLVLSVHSIVSFDFAVSIIPGWHTTIFPPYFVAGAVYAGFAMVLTFLLPVRAWYGLKDFVTMKHIDWMAKIMLATGLIVFYGYILEVFYGWYSGNEFELALLKNRFTGPYAAFYWALILCNGVVPQILWVPRYRQHIPTLFVVSLIVSIGMWLERFVIIPMSLHRDFIPASWGYYTPTVWDWGMFLGTIGFFVCGMFVFMRVLPMINIFEMKDLLYRQLTSRNGHGNHEPAAAGLTEKATEGSH
jgi:molybdopterin-containing oxidoreductase family membrane subunit